ncbi:uncharacterized protein STEHIDRAFT_119948 [Stereum hirsutum FP-91666 SS1]|uniref:uncharacterized protein n=1 Tax=Stereum hirsutum (strain FP-91666) TaxID=721885 RepID=UPI00044101E4|nr:uncharacterized protein STEHIDRAFT_119948 [Stereum hirsutum FP-91666 SS1]EIM89260.1 hypothetical protein STEHIDRAFT_119948 [Stereum hirsutum FP-91666 SS1]
MPITINSPLSLYSIPAVWLIGFYPFNAKFRLIKNTIGWDNVQPRQNRDRVAAKAPQILGKVDRYQGAHDNGHEIFPLWAAAVLAGNYAGLSQSTLNAFSLTFVGLRLLYNYIYINQSSRGSSAARSLTYFGGLLTPLGLFVAAVNNLHQL